MRRLRSWCAPVCSRTLVRWASCPIVRDAVAARLSAGVRESLHARAASCSLAPRRPEAVAVHPLATAPTNPQIAQAGVESDANQSPLHDRQTVEMLLGNAYRKLDITSRHQLSQRLHATAPN